jgi:predicted kinase
MAGVQQEAAFHAEGDVEVHTRMVAEAITRDADWRRREGDHAEFVAALMHDVSKPETTVFDDGRWQSPRHAVKGEKLARNLLWRGDAGDVPNFATRERICKLVRYHGLPLRFIDKPDPEQAIVAASVETEFPALVTLARADVNGRVCGGQQELLDRIELFKATTEELGVAHNPYPFESGLHRFMYFVGRKPLNYVPYDDAWGEVILMSGLPGGGKSTWVKQNAGDVPIVRMDDIREELGVDPSDDRQKDTILRISRERAIELLRKKTPFVWDQTNLTKEFRATSVALAATYGARVKIVYCEAPTYRETLRRNRERDRNVPEAVIDNMAWRLEVPSPSEAHEIVYAV